MDLINTSGPNVWAWTWWSPGSRNKVQWTIHRSVPGNTVPRLTLSNFNQPDKPVHVDCGPFDAPERFGSWSTFEDFKAYVEAFVAEGVE